MFFVFTHLSFFNCEPVAGKKTSVEMNSTKWRNNKNWDLDFGFWILDFWKYT